MSSIQDYWKNIRALESNLPEFVWVVGTAAGAPPFVTQVASGLAAKLLYAKSHRVAEAAEVDAHLANDAATLKLAKQERMRRTGAAIVVVEKDAVEEPTSEPTRRRRR